MENSRLHKQLGILSIRQKVMILPLHRCLGITRDSHVLERAISALLAISSFLLFLYLRHRMIPLSLRIYLDMFSPDMQKLLPERSLVSIYKAKVGDGSSIINSYMACVIWIP